MRPVNQTPSIAELAAPNPSLAKNASRDKA